MRSSFSCLRISPKKGREAKLVTLLHGPLARPVVASAISAFVAYLLGIVSRRDTDGNPL